MPKINKGVLVRMLQCHVARLHEIYVDEKDFGISDRLMNQILQIEYMIAELRTLAT
jgi:hypothetical protein